MHKAGHGRRKGGFGGSERDGYPAKEREKEGMFMLRMRAIG